MIPSSLIGHSGSLSSTWCLVFGQLNLGKPLLCWKCFYLLVISSAKLFLHGLWEALLSNQHLSLSFFTFKFNTEIVWLIKSLLCCQQTSWNVCASSPLHFCFKENSQIKLCKINSVTSSTCSMSSSSLWCCRCWCDTDRFPDISMGTSWNSEAEFPSSHTLPFHSAAGRHLQSPQLALCMKEHVFCLKPSEP